MSKYSSTLDIPYNKIVAHKTLLLLFFAPFLLGNLPWFTLDVSAMALHQTDGDSKNDSSALRAEGDRLLMNGIMLLETRPDEAAWQEAANELQTALQIYRSIDRRDLEASAWQQIGQAYSSLQQNDRALNAYENAVALASEITDPQRESKALLGMGRIHYAIGMAHQQVDRREPSRQSFVLAGNAYARALLLADEMDKPAFRARILTSLATLYVEEGRLDAGLEAYQLARELATLLEDDESLAQISAATGRILRRQGLHTEAIDSLQRALLLYAQGGRDDVAAEPSQIEMMARLHLDSGRSFRELGQWQEAVEQLIAARDLIRSVEDTGPTNANDSSESIRALEISILSILASLYQKEGDSANLSRTNAELFALAKAENDLQIQSQLRTKMAESFEAMGDADAALNEYVAALALVQKGDAIEMNNSSTAAVLLDRIGQLHWQLGHCDESIRVYESALTFTQDEAFRTRLLRQIGAAYQDLGHYSDSTAAYEKMLLESSASAQLFDGYALLQLGSNARRTGQLRASLKIFDEVIQTARSVGDLSTEIDARIEIGRSHRALAEPVDALRALNRALALTDRLAAADDVAVQPLQTRFSFVRLARTEALILREIGLVHLAAGEYDEAIQNLRDALAAIEFSAAELAASSEESGVQATYNTLLRLRLQILINLADATGTRGDSAGALAYLDEAALLAQKVKREPISCAVAERSELSAQIFLEKARLYRMQDQVALAQEAYASALATTDESWITATALLEVGDLLRRAGEATEALTRYKGALDVALAQVDMPIDAPRIDDSSRWVELSARSYMRMSAVADEADGYEQSLAWLNEALLITQAAAAPALTSDVLSEMARVYALQDRYTLSIKTMQQALALLEPSGAITGSYSVETVLKQAKLLHTIGSLYQESTQPDKAITPLQQALQLVVQKLSPFTSQAVAEQRDYEAEMVAEMANLHLDILVELGQAYQENGERPESVTYFKRAFELIDNEESDSLELPQRTINTMKIDILLAMADAHSASNSSGESSAAKNLSDNRALVNYERALSLAQSADMPLIESNIQIELGRLYRDKGEFGNAADYFRAALLLTESIGDISRSTQVRLELGRAYAQMDQTDDAIDVFRSALDDARKIADDHLVLKIQSSLVQSYRSIGNWEQVLQSSTDALDLAQRIEDRSYEASFLRMLGETYVDLGDYEEATNVLQQALMAASELGNIEREIRLKLELGNLYKTFADSGLNRRNVDSYEQALAFYDDVLDLAIVQSDYSGQHDVLLKMGQLYAERGDFDSALQTQTRLLNLAQVADNRQWEINALELLGRAYRDSGQSAKAVEPFQQALLLAQELSDRGLEQKMLENMAALYRDVNQPNKAIVVYEQLLDSAVLYGDPVLERKALENIGKLHRAVGATDKAIDALVRLLRTARTLGDVGTERIALVNLAKVRADQGHIDDALALLQQVLDTTQIEGYQLGIGQVGIGQVGTSQARNSRARNSQFTNGALIALQPQPIARSGLSATNESSSTEHLALAANTLREMGKLYGHAGQYNEAFTFYNSSLYLWRDISGLDSSKRAMNGSSVDIVKPATSSPIYSEVQRAKIEEARTLLTIGSTYVEVDQYRHALQYYKQALELFQPTYDITISSLALFVKPIQTDLQDDTTMQPTGLQNIDDTITAFANIADTYYAMGNYDGALTVYERAVGIARSEGMAAREQELLLALAKTQRKRRNLGAALELYKNALATHTQSRELGDGLVENSVDSAIILNEIGHTFNDLKRYDQAIANFSEALQISHELEETQLEAKIMVNTGNAYRNSKEYEIALEKYAAALGLYQNIGDKLSESDTLNRMGVAHLTLNQLDEALSLFRSALRIAEENQEAEMISKSLINLALTYEQQEDLTAATQTYAQAINTLSTMPVSLDVYQEIVALLIEGERGEDAFRYVQHALAQSYLHPKGNPWIDYSAGLSTRQALTDTQSQSAASLLPGENVAHLQDLVDQEQTIRWQMAGVRRAQNRLRKRLDLASSSQQNRVLVNRLQNERIRLANEHEAIISDLQTSYPGYATFFDASTIGIEEIQRDLLDEQTTIIQYFILERETVAWVINQDREYLIPLDVTYTELADRVVQWRQQLEHPAEKSVGGEQTNSEQITNELSATLAESLFIPLRSYVDTDNVIIIPHSVLSHIPFSALWDAERKEYLVERYAISYASSITQLKLARANRNQDGDQMVALGNPTTRQPLNTAELQTVAKRYQTTAYSGSNATESQLRLQAKEADLLHLALSSTLQPHQVLFDTFELRSEGTAICTTAALQDDQDGLLSLYELYELDLSQADLVVFSQSNTAVNRQSTGQEHFELQAAVHHAGAPTLLYSLWAMKNDARVQFFDTFYLGMQEQLAPTKALRLAQLTMLEEKQTRDPYYWATFVLTGDHTGAGRSLKTEPVFTPTPIPTPHPTPTPFILPPVWEDEAHSPTNDALALLDFRP